MRGQWCSKLVLVTVENHGRIAQKLPISYRESFSVGTVIGVDAQNDDQRITVRFTSVAVKKLLAKYAKLEPA